MKIGVISDTHIPSNCKNIPKKVKEAFKEVDMIIHAGDITELSVLDELLEITPNVEAVRGNMDSYIAQNTLPEKRVINAGKFKIGVIHGWGSPKDLIDKLALEFKGVDAIVFGHSHSPVNKVKNNVLYFNPGSATDLVFAKQRTVGLLDINDKITGKIINLDD